MINIILSICRPISDCVVFAFYFLVAWQLLARVFFFRYFYRGFLFKFDVENLAEKGPLKFK